MPFQGDRLEAIFTVALGLGLRQSEALGLQWKDVDFDGRQLHVRRTLQRVRGEYQFFDPKTTRSRRTIPTPLPVIDSLRDHRVRQLSERLAAGPGWDGESWGGLVFATASGTPLSGFGVTRRLRDLLSAADLPGLRYHDLRHGAASLMAVQGVPPRVAMEVLGHSQISTTMEIYSHIAEDAQREAVDRVAALVWGRS